jgi:hypothetical protein
MATSFLAYPSQPVEVGTAIRSALNILQNEMRLDGYHGWEQNEIAGAFIVDPIFQQIEQRDFLTADINKLNFNVVYEIGYAVGARKRVLLVRNTTIQGDDSLIKEVGLFDTLGYKGYSDGRSLAKVIQSFVDFRPLDIPRDRVNKQAPVYIVLPRTHSDSETHLLSRVKKAKLRFRSFDPEEQARLSADSAINEIASSLGVIVPIISLARKDAQAHNMRAAFAAGLARGIGVETMVLQFGDDPVPIDYRDFVSWAPTPQTINDHLAEFAPTIASLLQSDRPQSTHRPRTRLASISLGSSAAENEIRSLGEYYIETEEFMRVARGEVRIVVGRKGSGKSALFFQVRDKVRGKRNVVLDLRPEGFQLRKFKDIVLSQLEQGTKEHTITAFWEYLLLLEICYRILTDDEDYNVCPHADSSKNWPNSCGN